MTTSVKMDFSGVDKFKPFFEDNPKAMDKALLSSLLKGGTVIKNGIIRAMPGSLRKFKSVVAVKRKKPKDGVQNVEVGLFGRRLYAKRAKYNLDAFMILYWKNYGTLKNRDSGHQFTFRVRTAATNNNRKVRSDRRRTSYISKGGIAPAKFFEQGISASMSQAESTINMNLENELNKNLQKWGLKK